MLNGKDSMDDEDDDMGSPWADGQCSRTSGYQRSRTQVKKTMTSFNISSLVKDSTSSSSVFLVRQSLIVVSAS